MPSQLEFMLINRTHPWILPLISTFTKYWDAILTEIESQNEEMSQEGEITHKILIEFNRLEENKCEQNEVSDWMNWDCDQYNEFLKDDTITDPVTQKPKNGKSNNDEDNETVDISIILCVAFCFYYRLQKPTATHFHKSGNWYICLIRNSIWMNHKMIHL